MKRRLVVVIDLDLMHGDPLFEAPPEHLAAELTCGVTGLRFAGEITKAYWAAQEDG